MTITIEVFDLHALNLLRELEQMNIIRVLPQKQDNSESFSSDHKEFKAISIDTKNFKFNQEEANER